MSDSLRFVRLGGIRQGVGGLYFEVSYMGTVRFDVWVRELVVGDRVDYEFVVPDLVRLGFKRLTSPRVIRAGSMNSAVSNQMRFLNGLVFRTS